MYVSCGVWGWQPTNALKTRIPEMLALLPSQDNTCEPRNEEHVYEESVREGRHIWKKYG